MLGATALALAGIAGTVPAQADTSVRATVIGPAGADLYTEPGATRSRVTLGTGDVVAASCFAIVDEIVWIQVPWGDYAPRWARRDVLDLPPNALPAC